MIIVPVLCSWSQLRGTRKMFQTLEDIQRSFLASSLPAHTGITPSPALCLVRRTQQCFGTDAEKDKNVFSGCVRVGVRYLPLKDIIHGEELQFLLSGPSSLFPVILGHTDRPQQRK